MATVLRSMLLLLAVGGVWLAPVHGARAQDAKAVKQAAMVLDANTGKVLHEQFADAPRYPASLTKMMTLYLVFAEIEAGRLSYDTKITVSERANGMAPSKLGLEIGEQIAVIDAVKALITKSANDMAVALAEHIGGSEYQFAQMMTERARQIGMASTTFRNASGLPDTRQLTTARDMVTLGLRLQDDFPKHYRLFSISSFTYGGKIYKSHNTLMRGFPGMDGIKTGYTRASGFNLVSSVRTGNKHLVAAVFGGKTAAVRNAHMRALLYRGLQNASTEKTRRPSLIALPRPAAKPAPAAEAVEVAWNTETKELPKAKPVKTVAIKPTKTTPPPPAPAPAARPQRDDAIASVIAEGDAPGATAAPVVAESTVSAQPRLDLQGLREAMSEMGAEPEPPAARTLQASSTAGPQDIASLIRHSIVDGAQAAPAPPSTPAPAAAAATAPETTAAAPARAPSTLNSQATALTAFSVPPPNAARPAAVTGKGYEIQIGAYGSAQEAESKLELVRGHAPGLLDGHTSVTLPVQRQDRQIFRARFVNFDESAASSTCLELRRLAIDCFVMRAD
ncbi:MAG TPA: D-alanyl-D-alanine carboxypeptidase family protein [Hyphomicrobium sp.]|nr:D-alanyl-D-alanine carboxypeptidase family protein [Hyphomicrobium sp.]